MYIYDYVPMRDNFQEPPLDPPCEPPVHCPECSEESFWNKYGQIECSQCEECFDPPEPDFDDYDNEEWAYGY